MIALKIGIPSYYEEDEWPHESESWLFCTDFDELIELRALGKMLRYHDWRPYHCPPHYRITDEEASLLDLPRVDSLQMTLYCRAWRRQLNDRELPPPKSHKKGTGRTSGRPKGA